MIHSLRLLHWELSWFFTQRSEYGDRLFCAKHIDYGTFCLCFVLCNFAVRFTFERS